jgi:hypothetical protein
MARPDADAWRAAMEKMSLEDMGAFEEVDLPPGEQIIGLKWVFAYKMNFESVNILKKARVVAQGLINILVNLIKLMHLSPRWLAYMLFLLGLLFKISIYINLIARRLSYMPKFAIPTMLISSQDMC